MPSGNDSATPRCAASLSTAADLDLALEAVCGEVGDRLDGVPDLVFVFFSPHFRDDAETVAQTVCERLGTEQVLGCTGEAIVGPGREIEEEPAIALWAASLPGTRVRLVRLEFARTPEGGSIVGWPDELVEAWPSDAAMLLLGDPFSFPADFLGNRLNEDHPGVPLLGGMASGGHQPGANRLLRGTEVYEEGAVAAVVDGEVPVRSLVSQGCRPIGEPFVVTKAEQNVVFELGGRPALARLHETLDVVAPEDRDLVSQGLHLGRVINEYQEQFAAGDFLVRNCIGADREKGAIAVGDYLRVGQTVQFHVRDAASADSELRAMLSSASQESGPPPAGALLFTCNGRGTRLFETAHHDAALLAETFAELPVAGFFAQGELGPVGDQNFMHGFTAAVALFGPRGEPETG